MLALINAMFLSADDANNVSAGRISFAIFFLLKCNEADRTRQMDLSGGAAGSSSCTSRKRAAADGSRDAKSCSRC